MISDEDAKRIADVIIVSRENPNNFRDIISSVCRNCVNVIEHGFVSFNGDIGYSCNTAFDGRAAQLFWNDEIDRQACDKYEQRETSVVDETWNKTISISNVWSNER